MNIFNKSLFVVIFLMTFLNISAQIEVPNTRDESFLQMESRDNFQEKILGRWEIVEHITLPRDESVTFIDGTIGGDKEFFTSKMVFHRDKTGYYSKDLKETPFKWSIHKDKLFLTFPQEIIGTLSFQIKTAETITRKYWILIRNTANKRKEVFLLN